MHTREWGGSSLSSTRSGGGGSTVQIGLLEAGCPLQDHSRMVICGQSGSICLDHGKSQLSSRSRKSLSPNGVRVEMK
ncbi:hypothetical protein Tco_1467056 [Tanacetum coccineum]